LEIHIVCSTYVTGAFGCFIVLGNAIPIGTSIYEVLRLWSEAFAPTGKGIYDEEEAVDQKDPNAGCVFVCPARLHSVEAKSTYASNADAENGL